MTKSFGDSWLGAPLYATLSAALPALATPATAAVIVVGQFNSAAAVAMARYVRIGSDPGHALAGQDANGQWWTIHPDDVTLEAAGAPSNPANDCTPSLQRVLNYLAAATAKNQVRLLLGERDYILNSRASLVQSLTSDPVLYFSITGAGRGVSRLIVPYPTNQVGALAVNFSQNASEYHLRDFSVIASGATGANQSSGTALAMTFGQGGNFLAPRKKHSGTVSRVHIGPEYGSTGDAYGFFTTGLDVSGTGRPVITELSVCGCDGSPASSTDPGSPRYSAQTHLKANECYSPEITDSNFWHAATAVSYVCNVMNVQGFLFTGNRMEGVQTGVYLRHNQECPEGKVSNNGIQYSNIGFDVGNVSQWHFTENHFRVEGSVGTIYDMQFLASNLVVVGGNTFGSSITSPNTRVNVYIDADTTVNGVAHGKNFIIDDNAFGDLSASFATSAIQATASANHISLGTGNAFNGQFNGAPINDASGSIRTQVYAPLSWQPLTAPSAPSSGFTTWCDAGDGILTTISSSSKRTELAQPS